MNAGLAKIEAAIYLLIGHLWLLLEGGWSGVIVALTFFALSFLTVIGARKPKHTVEVNVSPEHIERIAESMRRRNDTLP